MPGHLDGLEFFLVGVLGIVAEALERRHPLMEIGEANGERIGIRILVGESDGNIFCRRPGQSSAHWISLTRLSFSAFAIAEVMISSARRIVARLNRSMASRIA